MIDTCEASAPVRFSVALDDGALAGWRWPNDAKPPLLFLHATGFCASAYRRMLSPLQTSYDIYALDLRGHGRTSLPVDPDHLRSWRPYVGDVRVFLDAQKQDGWILSGHSLGAATALMAAAGRNDVKALKLIEPVAPPEWLSAIAKTPVWPPLARRMKLVRLAARRRDNWASREDVVASYARKSLFARWAPGVLEDYLEDGLTRDGETVRLSCAPAWEAATFAAQGNDFWKAAAAAPAPVSIFAGSTQSTTLARAGRRRFDRLGARLVVNERLGHLAPLENPEELAGFLTR